jgi:hypothetical protein
MESANEMSPPAPNPDSNAYAYVRWIIMGVGVIYAVFVAFAMARNETVPTDITFVTFVTTCLLFGAMIGLMAFALPYLLQVTELYPIVSKAVVRYGQLDDAGTIDELLENVGKANKQVGMFQTAVAKLKGGYGSMKGITGYAKEALVAKEVVTMALILAQKAQTASGAGNLPDFSNFKI